MAKLAQGTMVRRDGVLLNPPTTVYFNTNWHTVAAPPVSYQDANGNFNTGTLVDARWYGNDMQRQMILSEAPSTINTRMNAANSTDVTRISLTRKNPDGTTTTIAPQIDHILYVQKHPDDNNDSLVVLQGATEPEVQTIKVDETAAAIASAANA